VKGSGDEVKAIDDVACQHHTSAAKRALVLYQLVCADGTVMREGDYVTLDASAGVVYAGELAMPMVPPADDINYQTVLNWADKYKRMMVLANADSVEEATKAFALGADGM
jgi:phosphoenolpyruvate synthase/pyruvate phosphate dikinase